MTGTVPTFVPHEEIEESLPRSGNSLPWQAVDPDVKHELDKLQPFPGWAGRARSLLGQLSDVPGAPNPAGWAPTTACQRLKSLRAVLGVAEAAGITVADFKDLLAPEVLAALHGRVAVQHGGTDVDDADVDVGARAELDRAGAGSNEPPAGKPWGYYYLGTLLKSIRTICAAKGLETPTAFRAMIAFCSDLRHRRDLSDRILPWADYVAGAKALDAFGRIALATGRQEEGEEYYLMGRVLAIALDGAPRRSELGFSKRDRVHANLMADEPELEIHVERETSKVYRPRVLRIAEPFAVQSLEAAMQGPGGPRLFRTGDGQPLSPAQLYNLLRQATILAVGVPASFNILRKVNTDVLQTPEERAWQLGHALGSDLARTTYHPGLAAKGRAKLARSREEYARRALEALQAGKTGLDALL